MIKVKMPDQEELIQKLESDIEKLEAALEEAMKGIDAEGRRCGSLNCSPILKETKKKIEEILK